MSPKKKTALICLGIFLGGLVIIYLAIWLWLGDVWIEFPFDALHYQPLPIHLSVFLLFPLMIFGGFFLKHGKWLSIGSSGLAMLLWGALAYFYAYVGTIG